MRVLICQTPKLTYVQAVEFLQREAAGKLIDLAVFPEVALEHPPQCTDQGELTFENVAFLMLSRFAAQLHLFIVLGSVEERNPQGVYETCVVIDDKGEFALFYRKQSVTSPNKLCGTEPGLFETKFGVVGVLLGGEVEEEERWAPILARRPCLVLNPTRAPEQMDSSLARSHPELQVAAWHQGFRRIEALIKNHTRRYACSFARADAPLYNGGAGTSIVVEPHRSVLVPSWGPSFLAVETIAPSALAAQRMPGWRQLTVDERIEAAAYDRTLLLDEDVELGPRYLIWTMHPPEVRAAVLKPRVEWSDCFKAVEHENRDLHLQKDLRDVAQLIYGDRQFGAIGIFAEDRGFLMPLKSHDGRPLYAVVSGGSCLTLWDVRLKRDFFTCNMGEQSRVTCMGPWCTQSQCIVAAASLAGLTFRVFDQQTQILGVALDRSQIPWAQWPILMPKELYQTAEDLSDCLDVDLTSAQSEVKAAARRKRGSQETALPTEGRPRIRDIFPVDSLRAIAIAEDLEGGRPPLGLLISLGVGEVAAIDVYGSGPPPPPDDSGSASGAGGGFGWDSEVEASSPRSRLSDRLATIGARKTFDVAAGEQFLDQPNDSNASEGDEGAPSLDTLVAVHTVEQRFQEQPGKTQRALMLLYESNRLCLLTYGDWELHSQMLLEDASAERLRNDAPLCCTVFSAGPYSGSFQLVVSYASNVIRWWQASLAQCRLQSHVLLSSTAIHVAVLEWGASLNEKLPGTAGAEKITEKKTVTLDRKTFGNERRLAMTSPRSTSRGTVASVSFGRRETSREPPRLSTAAFLESGNGATTPRVRSTRGTLACIAGSGGAEEWLQELQGSKAAGESRSGSKSSKNPVASQPAVEYGHHQQCSLLIVAFDVTGSMPMFLAKGGRITKAYTCVDLCIYHQSEISVDQVWVLEKSIAVQFSNGDLRHFEFLLQGAVIGPGDLPIEY